MTMSTNKKLMTINEAAAYLGLSVHTLYSWTSQRRVPFVKLGNRVRFDPRKLDAWLETLTEHPIADPPSKIRSG